MVKLGNHQRTRLFAAIWLFVVFVSVVDAYLVLRHRHFMAAFELNPFGRALITLNGGRVWYLLAAKFTGTIMACAVMLVIHHFDERLGLVIAFAVAIAQLGLLIFLASS
jgi:hypothetical protein